MLGEVAAGGMNEPSRWGCDMRRVGEVAGAGMWADLEFRNVMKVASQGFYLWDCWRCWFWSLPKRKIKHPCDMDDQTPAKVCLLSRQWSVTSVQALQPGNEALFEAEVSSRSSCAAALWVSASHGWELQQQCCCFLADVTCPALRAPCAVVEIAFIGR